MFSFAAAITCRQSPLKLWDTTFLDSLRGVGYIRRA
jgi:hypothetical protein